MSDYAALLANLKARGSDITLDSRHIYRRGGKYVPGVTTVLKVMDSPALDDWKVRTQVEGTARAAYEMPPVQFEPVEGYVARLVALAKQQYEHERLSAEAADVGKQTHALIEHYLRTQLGEPVEQPEVGDEALCRFASWKRWAATVKLIPLASEARVYHPEHDYCGTLDALVFIDGRLACIDFKPTATIYLERRLQLAAYRKALEAMGWPPMAGYVNCVPRDGGESSLLPVCAPGPELNATFEAFLSLLRVFRWRKEVEKAERKAKAAA